MENRLNEPAVEDAHSVERASRVEDARSVIEGICTAMQAHISFTKSELSDDAIVLSYESEFMGVLIGKKGQTLDALQYITNLIFKKRHPDENRKIVIDLGGYKDKRISLLEKFALDYAKFAREQGEYLTEPYSPSDRRIIHMTLRDCAYVTTEGLGNGRFKRILIKHKK